MQIHTERVLAIFKIFISHQHGKQYFSINNQLIPLVDLSHIAVSLLDNFQNRLQCLIVQLFIRFRLLVFESLDLLNNGAHIIHEQTTLLSLAVHVEDFRNYHLLDLPSVEIILLLQLDPFLE